VKRIIATQYKLLIQSSFDTQGRIQYLERLWTEIFCYEEHQILGVPLETIVPETETSGRDLTVHNLFHNPKSTCNRE